MTIKNRHLIPLLLISCAVIAVFGNSLHNGFVWDDRVHTIGNPVYRDFMLKKFFFSLGNGVEYLPLRDLTYAIDYAIWGEYAFGFHLTNLLLYLATGIIVYFMTLQVVALFNPDQTTSEKNTSTTALVTALLYAVHPIHSEAGAWITGRNVLLSGLFFFLSCSLYLAWLRGKREPFSPLYFGALICFLCALLSKATTLTLPLVLVLFYVSDHRKKSVKQTLHLVPFFALSLIFYLVFKKIAIQNGIVDQLSTSLGSSSWLAKAGTALQIPLFYFKKLTMPLDLSPEYDFKSATSLIDMPVVIALLTIMALSCFAFATRKKHPEIIFGLAWYLTTLLPVLNFFSTNPVVADRYLYLPSFGFIFIIAVWLGMQRHRLVIIGGVMLFGCWAITASIQNNVWKSDKSLWEHVLKVSPRRATGYIALGEVYFREGNYDKAMSLFAKSEEFLPANDYYDLHRGYLLSKNGDLKGAISAFKKAYFRNDGFVEVLYALGDAYERQGDSDQAIKMHNEVLVNTEGYDAISIGTASKLALRRLMAKHAPLLETMRTNVASTPADLEVRGKLALKLDVLGFYDEALLNYLEMERLGMKSWQLFFNTGNIYKKMKNYPEAAQYYEKCLHLNPAHTDAYNNLGIVCQKMKQWERAIKAFKQAIVSNEQFAYAPINLAILYLEMGDKLNSLRYFQQTLYRFPEMRAKVAPYMKKLK